MSISHRVVGLPERRRRAGRVEQVALLDRAVHVIGLGLDPAPPELGRAAARALGRIGRQEYLERRIGRDHRADVPALHDPVTVGDQGALLRRASPRAPADARRPAELAPVTRGRADLLAHVAPVEHHLHVVAALAELDVEGSRQRAEALAVAEIGAVDRAPRA